MNNLFIIFLAINFHSYIYNVSRQQWLGHVWNRYIRESHVSSDFSKTFFSHDITHCLRDHLSNVNRYQVLWLRHLKVMQELLLFEKHLKHCFLSSCGYTREQSIISCGPCGDKYNLCNFKSYLRRKTDSLMYWEILFENNLSFDRTYVEEFRNIVCFHMIEIWKQFKLFYLQKYVFCSLIYLCPHAWDEMISIILSKFHNS